MYEGWTVPLEYDPLLAKLIGYGTTREQCIQRLERALYEYFVAGIKTNISLFRRILHDPDFRAGRLDTGFLDRLLKASRVAEAGDEDATKIAAVAAGLFNMIAPVASQPAATLAPANASKNGSKSTPPASGWKQAAREEAMRTR
jgi:acetyl-CoA carboxylase biotin carboxylase subunit